MFGQGVFQSYLKKSVMDFGGVMLLRKLPKKGSWLARYRKLFFQCEIDWSKSGVDLDILQQAILTRNDFIHNIELLSAYTYQGDDHAQKYPASAFRDQRWGPDLPRLTVSESNLKTAIEAVLALATFIETAKQESRRY